MPALKNSRHEIFALEIAKGSSSREAYEKAGYSVENGAAADASASRLLKDAKILLRLQELHSKAEVKAILTLEQHMDKLRELRDAAHKDGKYSAAINAEVKRGELRRFYIQQVEHGDKGDFSRMSDAELDEMIKASQEKIGEASGSSAQKRNGHATKH